ncbi:MAG: hypothetical protein ACYS8W_17130 [Planctomycetota bacterium]
MGMPLVSKDTTNSVIHELTNAGSSDYFANLLDRVRQENPQVAEFLAALALTHDDPLAVSAAGLLIYRLLESQYEANRLSEMLVIGDTVE